MKCVIPQITWNSCQQILSLDFDPSCKAENGFYRLVTVGADTNLLIWHLTDPDTMKPKLNCVSELNRHQKAVNIIRFSPDGNYIASGDDDAYIIIWRNDRKSPEEENWTVEKSLRKHLGDVTDLSWSADSNYLLSASVDSSAVCWDVKKGASKYLWMEHSGYVQGASFDPLGEFAATISIDRNLRIYDISNGKLKTRVNKYHGWVEKSEDNPDESVLTDLNETVNEDGVSAKKLACSLGNHIFLGDDVATFCRRLCFSPRGEFLIVPTGSVPVEKKPTVMDQCDSPSSDPNKKKAKPAEKPLENNNAVILFCRNDLSVPCAVIPTGTSYSVSCRFNPIYFQRGENPFNYADDILNPVKKDERRIYCSGKLEAQSDQNEDILLTTPYRLVYAVATNNTVMVGSTDKTEPLAIVRNIHFARLTDLAWSPDGRVLVTSSTDGYCSVISFDSNELGVPFTQDITCPAPCSYPIPLKEVKTKEPKQKASTVKKEKTPAAKKRTGNGQDKTKTPKSATATPDRSKDKRKPKAKPIKLLLEAQLAAAGSEEEKKRKEAEHKRKEDDRKTKEAENKRKEAETKMTEDIEELENSSGSKSEHNELPNPYVHLVRLPENEAPTTPEKTETSFNEKSPAPIKFIPQKNTLDAWIIKKKEAKDVKKRERSASPEILQVITKKDRLETPVTSTSTDTPQPMEIEGFPAKDTTEIVEQAPQSSSMLSVKVPPVENSQSPKQKMPRRVALITLSSTPSIPPAQPEA